MASEGVNNNWICNKYLYKLSKSLSEQKNNCSVKFLIEKILFHVINDLESCNCVNLCYGWDEIARKFSSMFTHDGKNFKECSLTDPSLEIELGFAVTTGIFGATLHRNKTTIDKETNKTKDSLIMSVPMKNFSKKLVGVLQICYPEGERNLEPICYDTLDRFLTYSTVLLLEENYGIQCEIIAEILKYHTLPSASDIQKIKAINLPESIESSLYNFDFDDGILNDDYTVKAVLKMFEIFKFSTHLNVSEEVILSFIMTVKKRYRVLPYHNWRHGFNVTQMMFAILQKTVWSENFSALESIGLLVACLCHDVDHRGTSNRFEETSESPLAKIYHSSTMEEHHFEQCVSIIKETGLLGKLGLREYKEIYTVIRRAIYATDLANYFKNINQFQDLIESESHSWEKESHRYLIQDMLMNYCDLNAIAKPFEIQKRIAIKVAEEFYKEGDLIKEKFPNFPIIDMMNREKQNLLPKIQVEFIDSVCWPIYKSFAMLSEDLAPLLESLERNREEWNKEFKKIKEHRGNA